MGHSFFVSEKVKFSGLEDVEGFDDFRGFVR